MRISLFLFFMPLLAHADISLPDNAIEGFALHLVDEAGNTTYVHQSEFDKHGISTAVEDTDPTETESVSRRALPPGDSITCEGEKPFDIGDLHHGLIKLMEYLSCGYTIITNPSAKYKYVVISHYEGSSVIYICNYSEKYRTIKGPQLVAFLGHVFDYCGQRNIAGWYKETVYNMAWGYTNSRNSFCGPAQ